MASWLMAGAYVAFWVVPIVTMAIAFGRKSCWPREMPIVLGTGFAITLLGLPAMALVYPEGVGEGNEPIFSRAAWVMGWMFVAAILCGVYLTCALIVDASERKRARSRPR